jgi:hypothetical protein
LLEIVKRLLPDGVKVTVIGDGEFDGVEFLEIIDEYGWYFTIRTAKNAKFFRHGKEINLPKKLNSGEVRSWDEVEFTNEQFGPIRLTVWRSKENNEIIYLISNCSTSYETIKNYECVRLTTPGG